MNLFWANAAWLLRLLRLSWLAQLITDGYIIAPHPAWPGQLPLFDDQREPRPSHRPSRQPRAMIIG